MTDATAVLVYRKFDILYPAGGAQWGLASGTLYSDFHLIRERHFCTFSQFPEGTFALLIG